MRYLPEWLVESVLRDPYSMVPRVEWSIDHQNWNPLRVVSGSHTEDATSQTRWTTQGTFVSDYPVSELGIHPFGCRLRVFMDVTTVRNRYSIPFGQYVVTKVSESDSKTFTVSGSSFEQEVIESVFVQPRRIPDTQFETYRKQCETLITEAVPDARFIWQPGLKRTDGTIPRAFYDGNRWDVVDGDSNADSIMNALGGRAFCDWGGVFVFAPVPSLSLQHPVWSVQEGDGGAKISRTADLDRTGIHNFLTVAGDSYTGDGVGPAFAWDTDPNSITYAGPDPVNRPGVGTGPYGLKAVKYTNPLISTDHQAQQVATARIGDYLGFRREVSFESRFHPGLLADDVVTVEDNNGRLTPFMLDSITYNWGSATVSCNTRSTKAGDLSNAV